MKWMIAGGTGFIGEQLIGFFSSKSIEFTVVGRDINHIQEKYGNSVSPLSWDRLEKQGVELLSTYDLIINLAGANIGAKPWTKTRKNELLESRLYTARVLSELCGDLGMQSPPLFNASAMGIYPLQKTLEKNPCIEDTIIDYDNYESFSEEIVKRWEQTTHIARDKGVHVVNMRFGVVLSAKGGALGKMLLPYKLGLGGTMGTGQQPFSWIHIHDLLSAIEFLWQHKILSGPVNMMAPQCVTQAEFAKTFGEVLHRPTFLKTPAWALKSILREMADELLLEGNQAYPEKLIKAGFIFKYPTLKEALLNIFEV